jgi:hypothetical protein
MTLHNPTPESVRKWGTSLQLTPLRRLEAMQTALELMAPDLRQARDANQLGF